MIGFSNTNSNKIKLTPSKYQQAILDEVTSDSWGFGSKENISIGAVAGGSKTTTLQMISEQLVGKTMFVAFNKHISEELKERLSSDVRIATLNSTGLQFLYANKKKEQPELKLINWKMNLIAQNAINNLPVKIKSKYSFEDLCDLQDNLTELCNLLRLTYTDYDDIEKVVSIIDKYDLFENASLSPEIVAKLAKECIEEDIKIFEKKGEYDYNDQVFLPVKLNMTPPHWFINLDTILIDEAQDLSTCTMFLIGKLGKKGMTRYIFCHDKNQAIYSFAGSNMFSVPNIIKNYKCKELPLSVCYRCPKSHIRLAQKFVPEIEWAENAIEGDIKYILNSDIPNLAQIGDMVLARKNKELANIIVDILKLGKPIYIKDVELINKLVKLIKRQRCNTVTELKFKLKKYTVKIKEEKEKAYKEGVPNEEVEFSNNTLDLFETTSVLLDWFIKNKGETHSSAEFLTYIENIFKSGNAKNSVIISSVHCAKGAEAGNVFLVNAHNFPYYGLARGNPAKLREEENITYVAITRAKKILYLSKQDENNTVKLQKSCKGDNKNKYTAEDECEIR